MIDYYIFGFGLLVTLVVGFGLTTMIIAHNRAIEAQYANEERESAASAQVGPARVTSRVGKNG